MSGLHNNDGSDDEAYDYTPFFDIDTEPWQNLDDMWSTLNVATQVPLAEDTQHHQTPLNLATQVPLAEDTQHHQTLPHHVNQTVSAPVKFPNHPVEALVHNGGGSMMQNAGSSVRRKKGTWKPWTEEEHRSFLIGLQTYRKGAWKKISRHVVKTRSSTQVASHAQKYFLRQNASSTKKKRKSIHDITLHYTNGVPSHIDPHNSIPHPDPHIQQVHEMQQIQQMLPLNPPNSMTHQMSGFEYSDIANQQVHQMQQMLPLNPPNNVIHQMRGFENSDIAYQQVHEMQQIQGRLNPLNNMTHQMSGFENSDIAYQQVHEMQQMSLNPPNSMTHQMSGFDSDIAHQQVHEMQQILPVDPSNSTTRQMSGREYFHP